MRISVSEKKERILNVLVVITLNKHKTYVVQKINNLLLSIDFFYICKHLLHMKTKINIVVELSWQNRQTAIFV